MGRVEIEPEALGGDDREELVPERGSRGEVRAARPLVPAEDHRAVLDRDRDAAALRVVDEPRPHLAELAQVVRHVLRLVAADERAHGRDAEGRGRVDHLPQVRVGRATLAGVGMEVVRVVRERGDLEPVPVEDVPHLARVEPLDVDVRDARRSAAARRRLPASRRPRASRSRSRTPRRPSSRGSGGGTRPSGGRASYGDPAPLSVRLRDRVAEDVLDVAVVEGRVVGLGRGLAAGDVGVDGAVELSERVGEALGMRRRAGASGSPRRDA